MDLSDLTIILPTRNEAANIRAFLASIPAEVRLIVVDSSTDETRQIIIDCRSQNTVILHRQASISEARQIGAEAASSRWLLFTDADVEFAPEYFARLSAVSASGALYGAKRSAGEFAVYYAGFQWCQQLLQWLGIPAASGSNLLIERDAFFDVGGFDLSLSCNEDSELVWRVSRAGHRVDFIPQLVVREIDHRRLRRGMLRKTVHSITRCLMLYLNLMPSRWRTGDWNYWTDFSDRGAIQSQEISK